MIKTSFFLKIFQVPLLMYKSTNNFNVKNIVVEVFNMFGLVWFVHILL